VPEDPVVIPAGPGKGRIIVSGMCFFVPTAGVLLQVLHYLIGLRRLGYDPFYIEETTRWIYDARLGAISPDASANVAVAAGLFEAHGFAGRWAFRGAYDGGESFGLRDSDVTRLYRDADALLNVTGAQEMGERQMTCRRRIYVESDPFASHVLAWNGDAGEMAKLAAHDTHFSFGENLGAADCPVPLNGFTWLPTRQPVAMDLWAPPRDRRPRSTYTTITTWRNNVDALTLEGETYHWQKHREFERFLALPEATRINLELATEVDPETLDRLKGHGWGYHHATGREHTDRYRDYIWGSRAEFTVARDQYVRPKTGWFSDRSACYLAAGKPVVTQDTGFGESLPTGRGLFAFRTMDDILAAIDAIESDYSAHSRAAREIAAEYFACEKVVAHLMERAGL